jgi:Lon protease-like protein
LPHWPAHEYQVPNVFTAFLVQLFRDHDSIRTLYPTPDFESPQWICARLLEMMPIPLEKKTEFTEPASFPSLVPFLNQIITGQ